VAIETLISRFTDVIFPGYEVIGDTSFRVIRDSDIEVEEEAEDLVLFFKSAIKRRRRGRIIRLEPRPDMPAGARPLVRDEIGGAEEVIVTDTQEFLGIADLAELVDEDRPDLKFTPFTPRFPERIREHGGDCFAAIRSKDIVVHHPYETFDVVLAFLQAGGGRPRCRGDQADALPRRQAIGRHPRADRRGRGGQIGDRGRRTEGALRRGAEYQLGGRAGAAGVQVVYGFIDWKTHAKVSMVVRREATAVPHLLPFRHGQLSPDHRAHLYRSQLLHRRSALGPRCGAIVQLRHRLCRAAQLELLTLSPHGLRDRLSDGIDAEIDNARAGLDAAIWAR
jgi:polyphosphate kinase